MSGVPADALEAILAPLTQITRRVSIYESDGVTPFAEDVGFDVQGGSVTITYDSDTRRTLALNLYNEEGDLVIGPEGIWYDKVIKVWRGVTWIDENGATQSWETQLGEFYIDNIRQKHHPARLIQVNGRDASKKGLQSKFGYPTTFAAGYNVGELIKAIAANAGITKTRIPVVPETISREFQFSATDARWKAMKDIATAYNYELFMDPEGYLVLRRFVDPATTPASLTLAVGVDVVSYDKLLNDSFLFNHIIVSGEATNAVPVSAEVINTSPSSPTSVSRIGDRTDVYVSPMIETQSQANALAESRLAIAKLESFEISWQSVCVPSVEVGEVLSFTDPQPAYIQPTGFLLTSATIPLALGPMSTTGKRLEVIL